MASIRVSLSIYVNLPIGDVVVQIQFAVGDAQPPHLAICIRGDLAKLGTQASKFRDPPDRRAGLAQLHAIGELRQVVRPVSQIETKESRFEFIARQSLEVASARSD